MTRVIGAREVEQLAVGATLAVPKDAIITPLARDIIREKNLRIASVEAQAEGALRQREHELEAAEEALHEALGEGSETGQEQNNVPPQGEQLDEANVASVVEAAVKHVLAEQLLKKVDSPNAVKFAAFGPDGAALLRAVAQEVERCGAKVERLSGRAVAGLFVLAVALSLPKDAGDEAKASVQRALADRQIPVLPEPTL